MFAKSTYCIQYAQFIHTSMWKYMFIHMWIYGMPAIMTWSRRTPLHSATGLPVIPRQALGLACRSPGVQVIGGGQLSLGLVTRKESIVAASAAARPGPR